jgi:hypothetical protein
MTPEYQGTSGSRSGVVLIPVLRATKVLGESKRKHGLWNYCAATAET